MSRDSRAPRDRDAERPGQDVQDAQGAQDARGALDAALLTAYVDGVGELSPDERHRVEALLARDPQARADQAAVRSLVAELRDLRDLGQLSAARVEPDWAALERSIRQAVEADPPRPWWRAFWWLAPAAMLATAAAVVLVMWGRPAGVARTEPPPVAVAPVASPSGPAEDIVPLWLDGAEVDVALSASDLLGDPGIGVASDDDPAQAGAEAEADEVALLPSADLEWIDRLDEDAIERAERWLARRKG